MIHNLCHKNVLKSQFYFSKDTFILKITKKWGKKQFFSKFLVKYQNDEIRNQLDSVIEKTGVTNANDV